MSPPSLDVARYLARIGFEGEVDLDVTTLERLQRAHMTAVPFENLHVYHRLGVETGTDWSIPKIVEQRRGGWCFELNGAFAALLEALGFEVVRLGAEVLLGDTPPERPDHLTLLVSLDRPYLVDVGFGDGFIRPLRLDIEHPQDGGVGPRRLRSDGGYRILEFEQGGVWSPEYRFAMNPFELSDFDRSSRYLQMEQGLQWTEKRFATRLLDGGPDRVWLLTNRLRFRRAGAIEEIAVAPEEWEAALEEWFAMSLPHR